MGNQSMKIINFKLNTNDKNVGDCYLPDSFAGKLPVVIYCHGWGASKKLDKAPLALSKALTDLNMVMVSFDFFGAGETGGDFNQMTDARWASNLADVFNWVCEQSWADPKKIGCFGTRSGSTAALRFAEKSDKVAFVISVATCLGLYHGMHQGGPAKILVENLETLIQGGKARFFETDFDINFFKDHVTGAPIYEIQSIKCPVFFLQGADDNLYRRAEAWIGNQIMKKNSLPVKYVEIEGGDHILDKVPDECAREVVQWLREIKILS
jgi:pimeloyl-ACP methyl ester carboxylesterase